MVFYFTSSHDESLVIYVGKNKEENEELLKYAFPEDVWFHVDNFSSAHVYLRLKPGQKITEIPEEVLEECCQIVKANSISGCKEKSVHVIYTMFGNLKKTRGMDAGQVGFHKDKQVHRRLCVRDKDMVRVLNKTKREAFPDLKKLRQDRDREQSARDKAEKKRAAKEEQKRKAEMQRKKKLLEYDGFFDRGDEDENSGQGVDEYEESFM